MFYSGEEALNHKQSYTAADALPVKMLRNTSFLHAVVHEKKIPPLHPQFCPTNKCNLNCSFCSCSERDKDLVMSLTDAFSIVKQFKGLGAQAVTITGGGEPLCHPDINEIIRSFLAVGIRVGLVTNGLLLNNSVDLQGVTWCRISNHDSRQFTSNYKCLLQRMIQRFPQVDWAFSHVVSPNPNYEEIIHIVRFALDYGFTHVRIVADLLQTEKVNLNFVKSAVEKQGLVDSRILYQERNAPKKGGPCYIGYLKPVIAADCKVYVCCGVQYALSPATKDFPAQLCLGHVSQFRNVLQNSSVPFDGSICKKCYYSDYNTLLGALLSDVAHPEFV